MNDFLIGDRVMVCQHDLTHSCDDYDEDGDHWESRVVGWCEYHKMPLIAIDATKNPCNAEWPYGDDTLKLITDSEDWVENSAWRPGTEIKFVWRDERNLHYKDGTVLTALIECPHIKPEDWYVSFPVPDGSWRFKIVVNERDFIISEADTNAVAGPQLPKRHAARLLSRR